MGRPSDRRDATQLPGIPGIKSRRSSRRPELSPPGLSQRALVGALRRAGINEYRVGGGGELLSQPVLIVGYKRIYDQDGALRATFSAAESNSSFLRHAFLGAPRVYEVVDMRDRMVLMVEVSKFHYKAIAADGSDLGAVQSRRTWRQRNGQISQADGETIGSLCRTKSKVFSVRDMQDLEVGRITNVSASLVRRMDCNVVEIRKGMPEAMRALMLPASQAVFALTAPSGGG
jgi:hypothetical protein